MKSGPRHYGSIKRKSNRQYIREAKFAVKEGARVFAALLAVLAQHGGEITVTQGTIDQVGQNFSALGYVIVPSPMTKGEFLVRLTEGQVVETVQTPAPLFVADTLPDTGGTDVAAPGDEASHG